MHYLPICRCPVQGARVGSRHHSLQRTNTCAAVHGLSERAHRDRIGAHFHRLSLRIPLRHLHRTVRCHRVYTKPLIGRQTGVVCRNSVGSLVSLELVNRKQQRNSVFPPFSQQEFYHCHCRCLMQTSILGR